MRVLVACEESQAVTIELRKLGHEAYSCDLYATSGGHPEWHLQQDVIPLLKEKWDMIIAFPTCTYLTSAGTRHYSRRINPEWKVLEREAKRREAVDFFMMFANADCPRIAIENPVGYMNTHWRKADQIIHQWEPILSGSWKIIQFVRTLDSLCVRASNPLWRKSKNPNNWINLTTEYRCKLSKC